MGKALLAHHQYLAAELSGFGLRAYTGSTITDLYRLRRELQDVHERGWAIDREELIEGEVSLAAPIEDRRGLTVGAIGISGAPERLCEDGGPREELVAYVREAARAVSRELGAIPW
jgi:DNA-binding IclR family transcriptional regulator